MLIDWLLTEPTVYFVINDFWRPYYAGKKQYFNLFSLIVASGRGVMLFCRISLFYYFSFICLFSFCSLFRYHSFASYEHFSFLQAIRRRRQINVWIYMFCLYTHIFLVLFIVYVTCIITYQNNIISYQY